MSRRSLLSLTAITSLVSLTAPVSASPFSRPRPVAPAAAATPDVPDRLDLETAIAFALDNSFAIRQARERIRE